MSSIINPYEVLTIAQNVETNGINFYRNAAALHTGPEDSGFLLRLADMEEDHRKTFAAMQEALGGQIENETSDEEFLLGIDLYLKAISDSKNLEGSLFAQYLITGEESLSDIVLVGIDLEKETILYYLGLEDLMPGEKDKNIIDTVIREEKAHIITLAEEFRKIKARE